LHVCDIFILPTLHNTKKGLYFVEVALDINLIVGESGSEVVARVDVFDDSVTRTDFLVWNAEDGGGFGFENQFFHLRETINARRGADFEGFFGSSPSVCGG